MSPITPHATPRLRLTARMRKFRGRLLVASQEHNLELSESAEFIFRSIDGMRTVSQIGAMVAERYDIPADMATDDVADLIDELVEACVVDVDS
ncbi:PqqD family protein [Nocardia sp. NPDC049190]|uniref:PqqD family protein n=1 Tax=Nocardia sp. NPDC049190 TaxID=3155650 RepID=UPI0033DA66A9